MHSKLQWWTTVAKTTLTIIGALLSMASIAMADVAVAPAGRYILNTSTWSGTEFQVNKGTVTTQLKVGEILFSADNTVLTSTASLGGGGSGDITAVNAGYGLTGGGSSGDLTMNLNPETTSFIQNKDTLQAGASFYVQKGYSEDGFVAGGKASYLAYPSSAPYTTYGYWCNDVESSGGEESKCFYAAALYSGNPWAFYTGAGKSRFLETRVDNGSELRFYPPNASYIPYVAFKSSSGFTASDSNQTYTLPRATGTVNQVLAIQSVDDEAHLYWKTDDNGSGSSFGIVSPGTFTWTNPNGISVSTFSASATGTSISVVTSSATGTGANGGYFKCTGISCTGFIAQAEGSIGGGQSMYAFQSSAAGGSTGQINYAGYFSATGSNQTNRAFAIANGSVYTNSSDGSPSQFLMSRGVSNTPTWTYPVISLSTQTTGSLPASSIASGSLGANVIASSVAVGAIGPAQTTITGTPDGTKYLKDDWSWGTVSGGSNYPSNAIILKDADSIVWSVTISTTGALVSTSLGSSSLDPAPIQIIDVDTNVWNVTISTTGALTTELAP